MYRIGLQQLTSASDDARFIEPVTLTGSHATLEPLAPSHADADQGRRRRRRAVEPLVHVGAGAGPGGRVARRCARHARAAGRDALRRARQRERRHRRLRRATSASTRPTAGSRSATRGTHGARSERPSTPSASCLLLTHAFETLRCIAVEFRTHWFNHRSREAILRLGAKQDGVLRNHQLMPDGSKRDTVVFSILDSEWAAVKRHLDARLAAHASAGDA